MKKNNLFKKLGVAMLSAITVVSLGVASLTANVANAAYDYSETPKTDAYLAGIFEESNEVKVQPGFSVPSYMKAPNDHNNGVALSFAAAGASIITKKTYTVEELAHGVQFLPVLDSADKIQAFQVINHFEVAFIEVNNDGAPVKTVRIRLNGSTNNWYKNGWTGVAAGSEVIIDNGNGTVNHVSQELGGVTVSTATAVPGNFQGKPFLRKAPTAARIELGLSGTTSSTQPFKFAYVQTDDRADVITTKQMGGGMSYDVPAEYDNGEYDFTGMAYIRDLKNHKFEPKIGAANAGDTVTMDGLNKMNGLVDDVEFAGFSKDAKIKIQFTAIAAYFEGIICVTNLCGEDLSSAIRVGDAYNGYAGVDYRIPEPKFYAVNKSGEAFTGTVKVSKNGVEVDSSCKKGEYLYNLDEEGEYTVTYRQERPVGGKTEIYESYYNFKILPATSDKVTIKYTETPSKFDKTVGMVFNAGAKVESPIYLNKDLSKVKLIIVEPNGNKITVDNLGENYNYAFMQGGNYLFKYIAIDDVFTGEVVDDDNDVSNNDVLTREFIREIQVARNFYAYGDTVNDLTIDKNVVTFFDNEYGRNFFDNGNAAVEIDFKVKVPGATEFRSLTETELENGFEFTEGVFDTYEFAYALTYNVAGVGQVRIPEDGAINFTVKVIDGIPPVIYSASDDYLSGAMFESKDGRLISYKAVKNSTVTFGKYMAYDVVGATEITAEDITVSVLVNGVEDTQAPSQYAANRDAYSYTLTEKGEYIFKFDVTDGFNLDYICIIIDVTDEIYNLVIDTVINDSYTTNDVIKVNGFTVLNSKGADATNVTKVFEIYKNNELIETQNNALSFNPVNSGNYKVVAAGKVGNEVVCEKAFNLVVVDKTAPVIKVEGILVEESKVGEEIVVPTVLGTDNDDSIQDIVSSIKVTLNGSEINIYAGKFTPIEAGIYTVVLTSTDLSGNTSTYSYDIVVRPADDGSLKILGVEVWAFVLGVVGIVLVAGAVLAFLTVIRKKGATMVDENE